MPKKSTKNEQNSALWSYFLRSYLIFLSRYYRKAFLKPWFCNLLQPPCTLFVLQTSQNRFIFFIKFQVLSKFGIWNITCDNPTSSILHSGLLSCCYGSLTPNWIMLSPILMAKTYSSGLCSWRENNWIKRWFLILIFVFCYQNCTDLLWEEIVLVKVIQKNFWNLRLKAKNLQKFWDH